MIKSYAAWGYTLALNAYLLLHLACVDCAPPVAQANHIAHWVLLGGLLVLIGALAGRRWRLASFAAPGALVFVVWYGPLLWPPTPPEADGPRVTVATFNTETEFNQPEAIRRAVLALDADIIALQEAGDALRRDPQLLAQYPYRAYAKANFEDQLQLLSRYPIEAVRSAPLLQEPNGKQEWRYLRAELRVYGQRVVVYNFHPARPYFSPLLQYNDAANWVGVMRLREMLREEDPATPVLVLCDCNASPRTRQYDHLARDLGDTFAAVGWGLGLTHAGLPALRDLPWRNTRIDYVWHTAHWTPLAARVMPDSGGADHRPLWASLSLASSSGGMGYAGRGPYYDMFPAFFGSGTRNPYHDA